MPMLSVMKSLLSLSVIVPSCPKKSRPSVAAVRDVAAGHSPSQTRRRTLRPSSEGGRGGRTFCLGRVYHNEVWIIDLELNGTLVVQLTANSTSLFLRTDIVGKRILVVLLEAGTRAAQVQRVPFQCLIYLNGFPIDRPLITTSHEDTSTPGTTSLCPATHSRAIILPAGQHRRRSSPDRAAGRAVLGG